MAVIAIYPGTFDPFTWGHHDVLRRASALFETVVVAVARAHHKQTLFSVDERMALVQAVVQPYANVRVASFDGLLVEFARTQGACAIVRGVRSVRDFDFEAPLAGMNRVLAPEVETVFLTPQAQLQHISSTLVREIARLQGDVSTFVPAQVLQALQQKFPAVRA